MDLDKKLTQLEDVVYTLKREGAKVSEDTRKAIIHDVNEMTKEGRFKAISISITVVMLFMSIIAYIGYESLKTSTAEYVSKSQIKSQIIDELSKERIASRQVLDEAEKLLNDVIAERRTLEQRIEILLMDVDLKQKSLERVSNVISKLGVANKDIGLIIEPEMLEVLNTSNFFSFIKSFGLSSVSVIKLLASETEGFDFHNITNLSLSDNVRQIQERYELTVDGNLGPCTSLVIGGLLLEHYEIETRFELEASSFKAQEWLTSSFQTCSQNDKSQIQRYLDFSDLPLHLQLNAFVSATGMKRNDLIYNLIKGIPVPDAYRALNHIGYESL